MFRFLKVLFLTSLLCLGFSSPLDKVASLTDAGKKLLSSSSAKERLLSAVSRQTRRDRKPIEDRLLGLLAANGATLGNSVRGTPTATPQIIALFNLQRKLSARISAVRSKLYERPRVRGPARRHLILLEDVLFAQTFFNGLRIERALRKRPFLRGNQRRALRKQRALAIDLINARFGVFTI